MDCACLSGTILQLLSLSSIPGAKVVAVKCTGQTLLFFQRVGYHSIKTLACKCEFDSRAHWGQKCEKLVMLVMQV